MLRINGLNPFKTAILVLLVALVVPIALFFWTAAIGLVVQLCGGDALDVSRTLDEPLASGPSLPLTAVVMPAYNEDPVRIFAGLKATCESVEKTGLGAAFEFFILSDTTDPDIWVREELAYAELRERCPAPKPSSIGTAARTWTARPATSPTFAPPGAGGIATWS